jgi:hypothetical protein
MAKRMVLVVFISVLFTGVVFSQNNPAAPKNWIYGQTGLINFGAGYERSILPILGVGAEAYFNSFFILLNGTAVEGYAKWYPFKGNFYAKLGIGYGMVLAFDSDGGDAANGLLIDPAIGWKVDVGNPGGFFLEPKLGLAMIIGGGMVPLPVAARGLGFCF